MDDLGLLLTVKQAAERANVSVSTIRRWLGEGRFGRVKYPGRAIRIPSDWLDKFIKQCAGVPAVSVSDAAFRRKAAQEAEEVQRMLRCRRSS